MTTLPDKDGDVVFLMPKPAKRAVYRRHSFGRWHVLCIKSPDGAQIYFVSILLFRSYVFQFSKEKKDKKIPTKSGRMHYRIS